MKILWLSHLIPFPPKGGVLQRSYNMIKEAGKRHDITLVAFNQSDFLKASLPDSDDPLAEAEAELGKSVKAIKVFDIPENRVPGGRYLVALKALLSGDAYNMVWLKSAGPYAYLKKLLADEEFDVVHIDTISLCVFYDLFVGLPVVLNHHNFESQMLRARAKTERSFLKSLYYRIEASRLQRSEIKYCRLCDLNLTCSDEDAEDMRAVIGKDTFLTVPNGVDVSYFHPNPAIEILDRSIVIVGGLSWYPNREAVEYFIREIWPLIKAEIPGMRVDIVGRGATREMLDLAERDSGVFVHGFVDDVRDYLWRSQFYLCPIRTGGGTKLKILDALATGSCIIADPFACKGIKVRDGVDVLYARDPRDYVEQIKFVLANPGEREKLTQSGPHLISELYSYEEIGRGYSSAIEDLASERPVLVGARA